MTAQKVTVISPMIGRGVAECGRSSPARSVDIVVLDLATETFCTSEPALSYISALEAIPSPSAALY